MTERVQRNFNEYVAFLLVEHGIELPVGDPVLPALYVIHKEMQKNNLENQAIASTIQEATRKFNPKQFIFNSAEAANKFQRGITIRWCLIGGLVVLFTWVAAWYWSVHKDVESARAIIQAAGNMGELLRTTRKDKSGVFFIDFTASKGDSTRHFTEYQKINSRTVRVYLGRESR